MTIKRINRGRAGEEAAVEYLKRKGFRIVQRNFRCMIGELDIVATDGPYLIFVEVRTRTGSAFGLPQESITAKKKNKIRKIASFYLLSRGDGGKQPRFDVVAITVDPDGKIKKLDHIANAF